MNTDKYIPRKMGIALGTIYILKDFNATSRIQLVLAGFIFLIAIIGIIVQWNLDKEKKSEKNNDIDDGNQPGGD